MLEKVVEFAKKQGYDNAEYSGKWGNYDVYEPFFNGDDPAIVGLPFMILVQAEKIRMSTEKEAFDYLATLKDEE